MIPKILEYLDGQIVITPEAFIIKELNDIISKHEQDALPYLAYVHLMTHPESPYINLPIDEVSDTVKYDVVQSIGDFDEEDELVKPAIDRLNKQWETRPKRYYDSLGIAMDKAAMKLRNEELSFDDGSMSEVNRMIEKAGNTIKSYKEVEKQVDEELRTKMKGKSTLGDY